MKKIVLLAFVLVLLSTAVVWEFTGLTVAHTNDDNSSYGDGKFVFASSKTIWVPDNFTSIQEAINNASEGDTIFVRADTYYEHVTIDKSISLIGENRSNTIIDGSGTGTIITVSDVNNVAIEELTVQNGEEGIFLVNTRNITLARNDIRNNQYNFFVAGGTEGPDPQYFVHNIDSSNTVDGKPVYYWVGVNNDTIPQDAGFVALVNSTNITVQNLSLSNNGEGLLLVNTNASTILHNEINNCVVGLALGMCYNNTIVGNTIANSQDLCGNFYGFANNVLYHNNFLNSSLIVYYDMGNNKWDNGYPSGGNYWSNYNGTDFCSGSGQNETGSDGIGDAVYVINDYNQDNYPLMGPISFFNAGTWNETTYYVHTVSNSTVSDFYFSRYDKLVSFNVNGTDDTVGFCRVAIPRELMWCDSVAEWNVTVNGIPPTYLKAMEDADCTYLYFNYSHSIQEVQIRGIHVIPEFPTWTSMLLLLILLTVAIAIYKRILLKTPIH